MWQKFMGGWDIHGDKMDADANAAFFTFADIWKPEIRVCGGDLFDFRPLRKGATPEEQHESLLKDYDAGIDWLTRFSPQFFIRGNHDERLYELAEKGRGVAQDFAIEKVKSLEDTCQQIGCRMLKYDKRENVLRLGKLKLLHGFSTGIYACRAMGQAYGACAFGHTHTIDHFTLATLEQHEARTVGCLCRLDLGYNSRHLVTLRQQHGFPYGVVNSKTGDYVIWQAQQIDGQWILPTDYVEL
jgi:hypothetical protein